MFVIKKECIYLSYTNKQKQIEIMKAVTIETEMKRRKDLINNKSFVKDCIEMAKKLGITAEEWNKNKAMILMLWANEYCSIENKLGL